MNRIYYLMIFLSVAFIGKAQEKSGLRRDLPNPSTTIREFSKAELIAHQNQYHDKSSSCATEMLSPALVLQDCATVGTPDFYNYATELNAIGATATVPSIAETCTGAAGYSAIKATWARVNPDPGVEMIDIQITGGLLGSGNHSVWIQFFQGNDCSSLVPIGCSELSLVSMGLRIPINVHQEGIDDTQDVWMYIWDDSGYDFNLNLELIGSGISPINGECSGASNNGETCNLGGDPETGWTGPSNNGKTCSGGTWFSNENTMFYEIYPTSETGTIQLDSIICNNGIVGQAQFGVWKNCACIGTYTGGCFVSCAVGTGTLYLNNLIPGNGYILAIDGMSGDICKWSFNMQGAVFDPVLCTAAPLISAEPQSKGACEFENTSFQVAIDGFELRSYQWQVNDGNGFVDLFDGGVYSNTTTANLTLSNVSLSMNNYQYRCVITNDCGSSNSQAANLLVGTHLATPTITLNGNDTICSGNNVQLSTSSTNNILWSTGETTQNISVSSGGTYYVSELNNGCASTSTLQAITVVAPPQVTMTGNLSFCMGDSVVFHSSYTGGNLWSTGETSQSITVTSSGVYSLSGTNLGCSFNTVPNVVNVSNPITISLGSTSIPSSCGGSDASVEITGTGTGTITWTGTQSGSQANATLPYTINNLSAGNYSFSFDNGCSSNPVNHTIQDPGSPPIPSISCDITPTICTGENLVLRSSSPINNLWSTGETSDTIIVSSGGIYTLTVSNSSCSSTSPDFVVTENPLPPIPTITADGPSTICQGETVILNSSEALNNTWSNGALTQQITVSNAGIYTVSVTENNCMSSSSPFEVIVNPLPQTPFISSNFSDICEGDTATLSSSVSSGIQWSTGETSASINVVASGSYYVTASLGSCSVNSNSIFVNVFALPPTPTIVATGPTELCIGQSTTLASSSIINSNWLWSTGETEQAITVDQEGLYYVAIFDSFGCKSPNSDTLQITVVDCSSLSENSIENLSIFPNPASTVLNIEGADLTDFDQLRLVDVLGRVILESNINQSKVELNLEHVAVGSYTLQLNGKQVQTSKSVYIVR